MTASSPDEVVALLTELSEADALPERQVLDLLGALEQARAALWARLIRGRDAVPIADRLLGIDEAAARLAVTKDWLRRRRDLPFVVRPSVGNVRFSEQGIERFIRSKRRS